MISKISQGERNRTMVRNGKRERKVRLGFEVAKSISKTLRQCAGIEQQQQQPQLLKLKGKAIIK